MGPAAKISGDRFGGLPMAHAELNVRMTAADFLLWNTTLVVRRDESAG